MPRCAQCGFVSERPFRFCPDCGSEAATEATQEQRRTVTVVFCDLAGSTALGESVDPERLRGVLARYFERMKGIVESYGGTVEKFIGDAVMAVFGVPVVHEDDALRAVRAAAEMRDALPALGLEGRIGVMSGEVVTGTEERLVTGDAVNVAARLEQAAASGEVLIGPPTLALVRDAVDVEPVEPLTLKGKAEPVAAYRLRAVHEAPERRHDAPFVGRGRELAALHEAFARARDEPRCELVTVVGEAGIGKSRLVNEAVAGPAARVVRGRCLPYGEGITYWPVVEILKQLDTLPLDEAAAQAIRALLGESDAPTSADEIAWAFRKTLEVAAASRPLVVVFDDIQWGEQTFHDLIEHVALLSTDHPILLLCMARPELVERRPTWPVTLRLNPLADSDVDHLIGHAADADLRSRITRAAGGNPLFVGEMLAMTADGDVVVPPTLQALLAARLDQLEPAERAVLERGAIEGEIFHRGAVQALTDNDDPITPILAALARKQLIRPDKPQIAGDDGFRFRHLLLRDAAYDALPKATRADLHERLADWLEHHATSLVELDEILGYHLEQAINYREEIGLPAADTLATRARQHLSGAGRRARRRGDDLAALSLFRRAKELLGAKGLDLLLETELVDALFWGGRDTDALELAESIAVRAGAAGNRVGELCGAIKVQNIRADDAAALAALVDHALPVFEAADDDLGLYIAYRAQGDATFGAGRADAALEAFERAAEHSHRAGLGYDFVWYRGRARLDGTTQISELLEWIGANESRAGWAVWLRDTKALSLAYLGCFDHARDLVAEARELRERNAELLKLGVLYGYSSVEVELLAGDREAAARFAAKGCALLEEVGVRDMLGGAAGMHARALYELDLLDEADLWVRRAAATGNKDDVWMQMLWRQVQAKVLGRRGEHAEAEQLAREAVAICEQTDMLNEQGYAYADLGEVLVLGAKPDEAAAALEQALDRYERKGNLVMAERVRVRLARLEATVR